MRSLSSAIGQGFEWAAKVVADLKERVLSVRGASVIWLVLVVVVMFLLVGMTYEWHHGAGQGSLLVDIVWRAVWVTDLISKTLLIVVLLNIACQRFMGPRNRQRT